MSRSVGQPTGHVGPDPERTVLSSQAPPPSQVNDALVVGLSIAAAVFGLVFALGLTLDAPMGLYGSALAIGLFCLGAGVRRYFADRFPDVEALEPRHSDANQTGEGGTLVDLVDVKPVGRRPFLRRVLVAAAGVFGLSLAAPVVSLGPAPGDRLRTGWRAGMRLVTTDGELLRPDDVAEGGVSSVWPEGRVGDERSAVILLRLSGQPEPPTNLDWVVADQLLAYSKVCTHAGCPVALYRQRDEALFCPCHQSTFDVIHGAVPTFGPAARALPQLPLGVGDDGYLVALGDFVEPVGPAYG